MAKEVKKWITIHGVHIPIYDGESEHDALNRAVSEFNEKKKNSQIAKNKEQADKLNGKSKTKESKPKNVDVKKVADQLLDDIYNKSGHPEETITAYAKKLHKQGISLTDKQIESLYDAIGKKWAKGYPNDDYDGSEWMTEWGIYTGNYNKFKDWFDPEMWD